MENFNFDDVWVQVGELGRYQVFLFVWSMIAGCFVSAFIAFANVFLLYIPDYSCHGRFENCKGAKFNSCDKWNFDETYMKSTAVTKFGFICEYQYIAATILIAAASFMGLLGSILFGKLQDRCGRKFAMFLSIGVYVFAAIPSAFINNEYWFIAVRWIVHLAQVASFNVTFLYALEMTGPNKRTLVSGIMNAFYAVGTVSLGGLAYFFNDFFWFIEASSIPFLLLLAFYPLVDESPRWLLSMGRKEKAINSVFDVVRLNGQQRTKEEIETIINECIALNECNSGRQIDTPIAQKSTWDIFRIFRNTRMRVILLTLIFAWSIADVTYFAIAYDSTNLSKNFFISYLLQAIVELPASLLNIPILNRFGRILPLSATFLLASCMCFIAGLQSFVSSMPAGVIVTFAVGAKFGICMSVSIMYQLAMELYPTEVRGLSLGLTSFVSSIAEMAMPFIVSSAGLYASLPMIIMGVLCILGSLSVLTLPETKSRAMLETLDQVSTLPSPKQALLENLRSLKLQRNVSTVEATYGSLSR